MKMEDIVLLGGFIAIAIFGYYIMGKLDDFLEDVRKQNESHAQAFQLNIAASTINVIPSVTNALNDIRDQYPEAKCSLVVGEEQEVIRSFDCGKVDVAIVSDEAEDSIAEQSESIDLKLQAFSVDGIVVEVRNNQMPQKKQKVLWKSGGGHSLVSEFIKRLNKQSS